MGQLGRHLLSVNIASLSLSVKMNKICFTLLSVALTFVRTLPQSFSIGIGFGSDDSPLTFHQDESNPVHQSAFQAFQSQQSPLQAQQAPIQPQQSSFQPQQSFQSQQFSSQPKQAPKQSNFQPQQSSQSSRVTVAPPPARSAPAPFFHQQNTEQVNTFRQQVQKQRVFAAPTQPSTPQKAKQQEPPQKNADSHREALERNALHRQQLASVIEAHNEKVFSQFDDKLRDSEEEVSEEKGGAKQVAVLTTRRAPIPAKRPVQVSNFLGKPTPLTRVPSYLKKRLPDSIRNELVAHLDLINSLDKQVNELVRKASRLFSDNQRTPSEEERRT